ncbi:unnamed protein product [Rodentolepis nana]|uniref:MATH domain-containing protein n=1 Tax=Rodentolepis nana TaxID=102285 RepID=A0A0R3TRX2_RODNA|nr:unnamed protein product [Rodentolepis nana]
MNYNPQISSNLQLIRFSRLSDNCSQFLFLLPSSILRGFINEIDSSTFEYANHVWRLKAVRSKVHIGVYLELVTPNTAIEKRSLGKFSIWLDLSFTAINLEHFSDNQNFTKHKVHFNRHNTLWGSGCLIEASTVKEKKFVREDDQLLIELELSNVMTNLTFPLTSRSEDHFESTDFQFGGETWKISLTIDWEEQTILRILNQSQRQNLVFLMSFELSINSEQKISSRIELLIHHRDAQIQISEDANLDILVSMINEPKQKKLSVYLRDVKLYKFSNMGLPPGLSKNHHFLKYTEDVQGYLWNVAFSVSSGNLYAKLLPGEMKSVELEPNATRVVGWSWRLLNNPNEDIMRTLNHIFVCQQSFLSLYGIRSRMIAQAGTVSKKHTVAEIYLPKRPDLKEEEYLNFISPPRWALKVSVNEANLI